MRNSNDNNDQQINTATNKCIGKSWADGSSIGGFSLLSFSWGRTSNVELFGLNFNKIFSIISGCGQTEVYSPTAQSLER